MTDEQLASINALNQQFLGQQQQAGNNLTSQFPSVANNPGLSPPTNPQSPRNRRLASHAFDSLQHPPPNRAARTNNSAGFGDLTDELARQKGIAAGNQAQQNQLAFSNTAFQRQMAALARSKRPLWRRLQSPGPHARHPSQLLSVRANASKPSGFFTSLGNTAAAH